MAHTLESVVADYLEYADYEETGSAADCGAFITACKRLLILLPSSSTGAIGTRADFSLDSVRMSLEYAQNWMSANPSSTTDANDPAVLHHDFSEFTDR